MLVDVTFGFRPKVEICHFPIKTTKTDRGPGAHALRWVYWFLTRENILRRKPMTYHRVHTHYGMTGY